MEVLTRMFKIIWTAWCIISFAVLGPISFIVFFLLILFKAEYASLRWIAFSAKVAISFWGVRVVEHNKEILKADETYIYVANHRSDLDGILVNTLIPGSFKFLGKAELLAWPIIGFFVKHLYITVDRKRAQSGKKSVDLMKETTQQGVSIAIFPEGFSNFSNELLLPLKRGAFMVALQNHLPLAVFTIVGSHEIWNKPKLLIWPGTVHVYWEKIVPTQQLEYPKDLEKLTTSARTIFLNRLKQHYPNGYEYPDNYPSFEDWKNKQIGKY